MSDETKKTVQEMFEGIFEEHSDVGVLLAIGKDDVDNTVVGFAPGLAEEVRDNPLHVISAIFLGVTTGLEQVGVNEEAIAGLFSATATFYKDRSKEVKEGKALKDSPAREKVHRRMKQAKEAAERRKNQDQGE